MVRKDTASGVARKRPTEEATMSEAMKYEGATCFWGVEGALTRLEREPSHRDRLEKWAFKLSECQVCLALPGVFIYL
jgi:hypothetical protein